jgi:predicted acetyltransferase
MNAYIKLSNADDFFIIKNFIPLFRYYIGEVYNELPNEYGVFAYDDSKTLQEMCAKRESWSMNPETKFPFIIYAFDRPVGYMFVSKISSEVSGKDNYFVDALFLIKSVRRKGIGSLIVKQVFDKFKGKWELHTSASDRNIETQSFWRKVLNEYTCGNYNESISIMEDNSEKIIFRFCSI